MKLRSKTTIKLARNAVAKWTKYCRRRGSAHRKEGKAFICTGCAYDAAADAIEAEQRRLTRLRIKPKEQRC